ncbi:MAG: epoxyqueuosine reductase [Clostridiales bacterium]|jgi:epoxyqueuosine reductase|nr:epoxyqueuosine reductase [Clostridiales bacterium]
MKIKQAVKKAALRAGMDMCGIAGIDRFSTSPPGKHPQDILPGCRSVIVVGVRLLDGVIQANFRDFEDGRSDLKGIYGTYGYSMLPNFELTYACYAVAQLIERKTGEIATPCSTGPMTNGAQISIRHAAVAAGLGEFGWMSIVLTPQFGPRNRFGVILTTAEIEPDPMYEGERLCNPEKCGICTSICPVQALSKYGDKENTRVVKMGGKRYEYCSVGVSKCHMALMALKKELGGRENFITTDNPTPEQVHEAQLKAKVDDLGLQHTPSWYCGKCLSYCPAGNWGEKFKKTGLSKGAGNIK